MSCGDNQNHNCRGRHDEERFEDGRNSNRRDFDFNERNICCCNNRFTFNLDETSDNVFTLTVTPCTLPTAVFDVATITVKENSCNQIEFFQAAINTDPVQIIQDCSLRDLICRSINCYFNDATLPTCSSNRRNFSWF